MKYCAVQWVSRKFPVKKFPMNYFERIHYTADPMQSHAKEKFSILMLSLATRFFFFSHPFCRQEFSGNPKATHTHFYESKKKKSIVQFHIPTWLNLTATTPIKIKAGFWWPGYKNKSFSFSTNSNFMSAESCTLWAIYWEHCFDHDEHTNSTTFHPNFTVNRTQANWWCSFNITTEYFRFQHSSIIIQSTWMLDLVLAFKLPCHFRIPEQHQWNVYRNYKKAKWKLDEKVLCVLMDMAHLGFWPVLFGKNNKMAEKWGAKRTLEEEMLMKLSQNERELTKVLNFQSVNSFRFLNDHSLLTICPLSC